jgi:hypothetical protein
MNSHLNKPGPTHAIPRPEDRRYISVHMKPGLIKSSRQIGRPIGPMWKLPLHALCRAVPGLFSFSGNTDASVKYCRSKRYEKIRERVPRKQEMLEITVWRQER